MNAQEKLVQARIMLLFDQPFFGTLALRLRLHADNDQPTGYTDGKVIGYNEKFVEALTDRETQGLVGHEVLHLAYRHLWRRDERDMERWNIACDYAINLILTDAGFSLPKGALLDQQYRGLSAEAIYAQLLKDQKPQAGGWGNFKDPATGEGETAASTQADWEVATVQAAKVAKKQGKLPASMSTLIEELLKPVVHWQDVLRRFGQDISKADYTWRIPNQRYMAQGLFMPSLRSQSMPPICVGIDTSGSIDDKVLAKFAAEIQSIVDEVSPEKTVAIYCDAKVQKVEEFEPGDQIKLTAIGRGGTSFEPVFSHVEQEDLQPACLIYLTDLYGSFPAQAPDYPVLWATIGNPRFNAPFGEEVTID